VSVKDAAARAAMLAALHDAIGAELKAARALVGAGLADAKKATGTTQISAELPDGTPVAKVTLVSPDPVAEVADDKAFLAWVRKYYPDEVASRLVVEVRPAFVDRLLKEMTAAKVARWCDKETGELHDVPGVVMQGRASHQRLTFEKTGKADIAAAWREGRLSLPDLLGPPELPPAT
jgi:hypothetical protein